MQPDILKNAKPAPGSKVSTRAPQRSAKQEARSKHQAPTTDSSTVASFGVGTVPLEIVEAQIRANAGLYHPSNTQKLSLQELKENAETLRKALNRPPSPISAHTILAEGKYKCPSDFYDGPSDKAALDSIDAYVSSVAVQFGTSDSFEGKAPEGSVASERSAASNFVPIYKVVEGMCAQITKDQKYHTDRAKAYMAYLAWVSEQIEASLSAGGGYETALAAWQKKKDVVDIAEELYENQRKYENTLTDQHLREIQQQERITELENLVSALSTPKEVLQ